LDLTHIDTGEFDLAENAIDAPALFDELIARMTHEALMRKLYFDVDIDRSLPLEIIGDGHRLDQIFYILLSNAVVATPEGGTVSFAAQLVQQLDDLCIIRFIVSDTGLGLSPDDAASIWDTNTHNIVKSRGLGLGSEVTASASGLALPLVKHLVDLMGGDLTVKSSTDSGTSIICTLPFGLNDTTRSSTIANSEDADLATRIAALNISVAFLKDKRILVVDDVAPNREYLQRFLEAAGAVVDVASNGADAVNLFVEYGYDAILLDLTMPVMDGFEAAENIRLQKVDEAGRVRIIGMASDTSGSTIARLLQAGMDDYAAKPVDIKGLIEMLEQYLIW
jgi:CheY-like chemotaxis protein